MTSKPVPVLELDYAHEILGRVRALSVRHEALLAGFWNPARGSFSLGDPLETTDHVTSSCTCVLSFLDAGVNLPSFVESKDLVRWLLSVQWESADLGPLNLYTTPIALTTLLALAPERVVENRAHDAIRALVNATLDVEPGGPVCFGDYPPSAFLTYWTLRGLSAALSAPGSDTSRFPRQRVSLAVTRAAEWVDGELHRQFSYHSVGDLDRFNVFEMCYLLAASDLARRQRGEPADPRILGRGIQILFEVQLPDGLWPLGKPIFLHPSLGQVYPFALEPLTAVMRIGQARAMRHRATPGVFNTAFFREHLSGLMRVVGWIEGNELSFASIGGWRSNSLTTKRTEEVRPQSWSTAAVMLFSRQVEALLQSLVRDQRLQQLGASLHPTRVASALSADTWSERVDSEARPTFDHQPHSLKELVFRTVIEPHLRQHAIRPWSAILFGPPGTAKTTMASEIAAALGWPLVSLGISDFLTEGEDQLVHRAHVIFNQLAQLTDAVIILDEIEELVRSRKAEDAHPSGRLTTTAMLTLLQRVLDTKATLFLAATNHLHDIDRAVRRRFDAQILVLPPTFAEKLRLFRELDPPFEAQAAQRLEVVFGTHKEVIDRLTFAEWKSFLRTLRSHYLVQSGDIKEAAAGGLLEQLAEDSTISTTEWQHWQEERSHV